MVSEETQIPAEPYVAMVGRNNRDLASFCAAVELAGIKGVLITSDYMLNDFDSENYPNVCILADQPMEECLNYVAGAFAHLVLVCDDLRGAGHISAVSAMLLSKPQIFSDVSTLSDYLITDFNGIAVGIGDVKAIADAICKLQNQPEFAARLGESGKNFALDLMTHAQSTTRCAEAVKSAYDVY